MKVKIKRTDNSTVLPMYHTAESAGFDLAAAADVIIEPGTVAKIPTNLIIETPKGYFLLITARSSLALKKGLMMANGVGIIDPDYSGPEDKIYLILYNFTNQPVTINQGERLAQGIFLPSQQVIWEEIMMTSKETNRGGFGSTGTK